MINIDYITKDDCIACDIMKDVLLKIQMNERIDVDINILHYENYPVEDITKLKLIGFPTILFKVNNIEQCRIVGTASTNYIIYIIDKLNKDIYEKIANVAYDRYTDEYTIKCPYCGVYQELIDTDDIIILKEGFNTIIICDNCDNQIECEF